MEFFKKESTSQTTQSFTQRLPLGQKNNQNLPFVSQIQELMSMLVQKKSQLKEAKLKQANLIGKQEQQQMRISKIKVAIQHEIQKEQMTRCQQQRQHEQIKCCKAAVQELTKCIKTVKSELGEILEDIITGKKSKIQLENACAELQYLIKCKTTQNIKIDEQIQNLETLIISTQNDVRSKQDELTNLHLQKTEICSLINFLEQKLKMGNRARNSAIAQGNDLVQQITKTQQKIYNIKRENNQIQWSCEQIRSQNSQISDLNQRLQADLESVRKHLCTMEKMNQLLQNSLTQYGITGEKVTRIINTAKNQ